MDPVEITSIPSMLSCSPSFMIEPLPKARSMSARVRFKTLRRSS